MAGLGFGSKSVTEYARGLRTSITDNSAAYGYSVSITVTLAATTSLVERPSVPDLFLFVVGAAAAFAGIEGAATLILRDVPPEPQKAAEIGSVLSVFSIGLALGAAVLVGAFVTAWVAWPLASFAATLVYIFTRGVEIGLSAKEEKDD